MRQVQCRIPARATQSYGLVAHFNIDTYTFDGVPKSALIARN
jgi:hypothetical protein